MAPDLAAPPLTHEEFVSLRDGAKGLMHRFPIEHKKRLIELGYIEELLGGQVRWPEVPQRALMSGMLLSGMSPTPDTDEPVVEEKPGNEPEDLTRRALRLRISPAGSCLPNSESLLCSARASPICSITPRG